MRVRVGCNIVYICPQPTPMLFVLRPSLTSNHMLIEEKRLTNPTVTVDEYFDTYGNQIWRLVAPFGRLQIEYDALVEVPPTPDLVFPNLLKTPVENLPYDTIIYTLPSRLCPSDMFVAPANVSSTNVSSNLRFTAPQTGAPHTAAAQPSLPTRTPTGSNATLTL